ncbi:MAG: SusC/RagA family TonB-linked outer membrane protein [Bacteroidetes bacterium]|jgi:iron complex outermembrane receptor protein|nr:SusC/RagA family TonB-linked outer membrane protein [Bacteroidota bacterium]
MHFKNLLKVSCCFILLCLFALPALAQNVVVTGKVTDSKDGSPIPGVSIVAKGSTSGTVTDVNGNFKLSVPSSVTTLSISFVGYNKKDVALTGAPLNIALDASSTALNEVLVVGYGTVRKKDATGAVVKVSSDDFVQGVTTNPLQQLQGKTSGVVITTASGDPNDNPIVRIRGTVSLSGGNDPLYVIDGVAGADIRGVSPNDIESFDILKDASAAAIYGARAAGGVIIVTTKAGKAGKAQVSVNSYVASESPEKLPNFMNASQYLSAYSSFYGHDMATGTTTTSNQGANTDWFKLATRTAFTHNENLALSGGTEKGHYRASVTYNDQGGIAAYNSDRKDLNGRFNFDQKALDDKLLITIDATGSHTNQNMVAPSVWTNAGAVPSVISPFDPVNPGYYQYINNTAENNPIPEERYLTNNMITDRLTGNLRLDYTLAKGLTLSPYANASHGVNTSLIWYPPGNAYSPVGNLISATGDQFGFTPQLSGHGDVDKGESDYTNTTYGATLDYKLTFGKSRLHVLGGYEKNVFAYSNFRVGAHDFNDINQPNIAIGSANSISNTDIGSDAGQYILKSWLGRAEYNLSDKYNLTANIRYDWSNKLGINNQSGVFPSFGASWTISNEDFMKGVNWISSLKLRGSWGQTGDQGGIGDYTSQFLLGPNGKLYYDGASGTFLPANFSIQNQNTALRWEVVTSTDIATDFSLFNGRLNGSFDWYNKKTNHLLYPYTVPTGGSYFVPTIIANIGSMSNKGFEFNLNYKVFKTSDFSWTTGGNFGLNRNKILNLSGTLNNTQFNVTQANVGSTSGLGISGAISDIGYLKVGYPVGTLLLPQYAGQDATGKQLFWHYAADGSRTAVSDVSLLNYADDGSTQDRKFYTTDPKFTYAINNTFTYKNFDLNIFLRGQYGSHAFNEAAMDFTSLQKLGTYAVLADASQYHITSSSEPSSFWWQSTSFLKVQSATLGYNFNITNNRYIDKLHVYVAGNNLYTFTSYKGIDPEINNAAAVSGSTYGIDVRSIYPRARQISFGINLILK